MTRIATLDKRVYDLLAEWRQRGSKAWDSGFLGLIVRFLPWFEAEGVEYLFHYTVAIRLHGGECGQCASLTVTPDGWRRLCETQGDDFVARPDGDNGQLSVRGWGYASTVKFRESLDEIRTSVYGVYVASLPYLIGNFLSRPNEVTRGFVSSLIRANDLDDDFRRSLPAGCRAAYRELVDEARKERK